MKTFTLAHCLLFIVLLGLLACGTGGPTPPRGGTPEWHWENAAQYYDRAEFTKMIEELDAIAERDTPLSPKAVIWRTALLLGLANGYKEMGDAYRAAIEENEKLDAQYQNSLQQVNRDTRQYAIELAESIGAVDKAMSGEKVVCEFPFPGGNPAESVNVIAIRDAKPVDAAQEFEATESTVRRAMILAATEYCGIGQAPEDGLKARSLFETGPVEVAKDQARLTFAKMLLDTSLVFSRERVNEPNIREIFVNRSEEWIKPYLESENDDLKKRATDLMEEVEDERRDMKRQARRLKKRE